MVEEWLSPHGRQTAGRWWERTAGVDRRRISIAALILCYILSLNETWGDGFAWAVNSPIAEAFTLFFHLFYQKYMLRPFGVRQNFGRIRQIVSTEKTIRLSGNVTKHEGQRFFAMWESYLWTYQCFHQSARIPVIFIHKLKAKRYRCPNLGWTLDRPWAELCKLLQT